MANDQQQVDREEVALVGQRHQVAAAAAAIAAAVTFLPVFVLLPDKDTNLHEACFLLH